MTTDVFWGLKKSATLHFIQTVTNFHHSWTYIIEHGMNNPTHHLMCFFVNEVLLS